MIDLVTRYAPLAELSRVPAEELWLTASERDECRRFHDISRRKQWTLARWLSKRMIGDLTGAGYDSIEVLSREAGLGRRPRVRVDSQEGGWSLSISHTQRGAFVGLARHATTVGVDLASEVPSDDRFRSAWFTPLEQRWLAASPLERTATLWALKEAAFKACNAGEPWSPRKVEIVPTNDADFSTVSIVCRYFGRLVHPTRVEVRSIDGHTAATICMNQMNPLNGSSVPTRATLCS